MFNGRKSHRFRTTCGWAKNRICVFRRTVLLWNNGISPHLLVLDVALTRDWFRLTNVQQVPSAKKTRYTPTASTEENARKCATIEIERGKIISICARSEAQWSFHFAFKMELICRVSQSRTYLLSPESACARSLIVYHLAYSLSHVGFIALWCDALSSFLKSYFDHWRDLERKGYQMSCLHSVCLSLPLSLLRERLYMCTVHHSTSGVTDSL